MKKYQIYVEDRRFCWTNNIKIFLATLVIFILAYIVGQIQPGKASLLKGLIVGVIVIFSIVVVYLKFFHVYSAYQPFRGKLEGYLVITKDEIIVSDKKYHISDIKDIEVWNFDFKDDIDFLKNTRLNFNGIVSNGIENQFKIKLENQFIDIRFQQCRDNQIIASQNELKEYYLQGKISIDSFSRVLGLSVDDTRDLVMNTAAKSEHKKNHYLPSL